MSAPEIKGPEIKGPEIKGPEIKGWCPGALRPMMSGDGLVVRIRPPMGRLTRRQTTGIAILATSCGNGIIDLSNRANVQLRGVRQDRYDSLITGLRTLNLIDANATIESRRNIIITPFHTVNDDTEYLANQLTTALAATDAPDVSAKFGYAIDAVEHPVLQSAPADIRLERAHDGTLILCAADHPFGKPVTLTSAIPQMLILARWTLGKNTRMARVLTDGTALPKGFTTPRHPAPPTPTPALHPAGALIASAFGQITAATFGIFGAIRVTPWRMVLIEGATAMPTRADLITTARDPLLRVVACTGAPACTQAHRDTRALARTLAPLLPTGQTLHVSGCAKGCAMPRKADITLTATPTGFNLIRNNTADAAPTATGLTPADLPDLLQKAL